MRALVGLVVVLLAGAAQAQQPSGDGGRGKESARDVGEPSRPVTGGESAASRRAPGNKMRGSPMFRILMGTGPRLSVSEPQWTFLGPVVAHERFNADFIWGFALGYEHNLIVDVPRDLEDPFHDAVSTATTSTGLSVGGLMTYLRTGEEPFAMGGAALGTTWRAAQIGFFGVGAGRVALGRFVGAGARLGLGGLQVDVDYAGFNDGGHSEILPAAVVGLEFTVQFSPQGLPGWHLDGRSLGLHLTLDWYAAPTATWRGASSFVSGAPLDGRARYRPSHWALGLGVAFAI